jgi:signal transduction histidine kinase
MSVEGMTAELRRMWSGGEQRYGLGLHLKLVLAGAVTTLVGVASVSSFIVYSQAHLLRDEIDRSANAQRSAAIERARLLARTMSVGFENSLAAGEFAFVNEAVRSVQSKNTDIVYAFVADAAGKIVVHTEPARLGSMLSVLVRESDEAVVHGSDTRRLVEILQPLVIGGAPWGHLVLALDLRPVDTRAAEARMRGEHVLLETTVVVAGVAAIATLLCIAASILLSRRFLRPIVRLAEDAGALTEGNLDHEIRAVDSADEIGFLARQFELMRRSMKAYIGALVVAKQKAEAGTREEKRLRAQIEEHSRLLEVKVKERTAELQRINAQLTEYDRMKSEFLSNVSHELRSPLAAIASAAKIIGRYGDVNKTTGKNFSSVILDETDRLGRLINDLLDLAKIESGKVEWNMERIDDATELITQVVDTYRPLAEERGIDIELGGSGPLPAVVVDRDRMLQVLTNLCSNAVKFTPRGGRITVSGERTKVRDTPALLVKVQDTGPGIPSDELEKVFDRFHQVKVKHDGNKPKGTGLGLAICREVVSHHGGEIWAEAPPEGGARMVFYVPAAEPITAVSAQRRLQSIQGAG